MSTFRVETPVSHQLLPLGDLRLARWSGWAAGRAAAADGLVGPAAAGIDWRAGFEVIAPADPADRTGVLVEIENRGRPLCLGLLTGARIVREPPSRATVTDAGNGFLFRQGLAYARIQWQFGFAELPADGQAAGLVILRDFGRALRDGALDAGLPAFDYAYLAGYSQGGRFVRTFYREGFNRRPEAAEPVYQGLLAWAGGAGYLPINRAAIDHGLKADADNAHGGDVPPYRWDAIAADAGVRARVIEVFTTTEYVNRRGSLVTEDPASIPADVRHYDLPGTTHILIANDGLGRLGLIDAAQLWTPVEAGGLAANGGVPLPLNPVDIGPYLRACVRAIDDWVRAGIEPPPSAIHPLRPAAGDDLANPLAGADLRVPATDDLGNPVGGVRVPDVEVPLGSFTPTWLTGERANTRMIGAFRPLDPIQIAARYPNRAAYLAAYASAVDRLIGARHLLAEDRPGLLQRAAAEYDRRAAVGVA